MARKQMKQNIQIWNEKTELAKSETEFTQFETENQRLLLLHGAFASSCVGRHDYSSRRRGIA